MPTRTWRLSKTSSGRAHCRSDSHHRNMAVDHGSLRFANGIYGLSTRHPPILAVGVPIEVDPHASTDWLIQDLTRQIPMEATPPARAPYCSRYRDPPAQLQKRDQRPLPNGRIAGRSSSRMSQIPMPLDDRTWLANSR